MFSYEPSERIPFKNLQFRKQLYPKLRTDKCCHTVRSLMCQCKQSGSISFKNKFTIQETVVPKLQRNLFLILFSPDLQSQRVNVTKVKVFITRLQFRNSCALIANYNSHFNTYYIEGELNVTSYSMSRSSSKMVDANQVKASLIKFCLKMQQGVSLASSSNFAQKSINLQPCILIQFSSKLQQGSCILFSFQPCILIKFGLKMLQGFSLAYLSNFAQKFNKALSYLSNVAQKFNKALALHTYQILLKKANRFSSSLVTVVFLNCLLLISLIFSQHKC